MMKILKNLELSKNHQKILRSKFYKIKRNLGAGRSRNNGIKKSKGKFVSFIDADDIWAKNKIKEQVKFIRKK